MNLNLNSNFAQERRKTKYFHYLYFSILQMIKKIDFEFKNYDKIGKLLTICVDELKNHGHDHGLFLFDLF